MKDKVYKVLKKRPPFEIWQDLSEESKAKVESDYPGLAAFYEGFENFEPIVREALERGLLKGRVKVESAWIEHCFSCGAFGGYKTVERPGGGIRVLKHRPLHIIGYDVNKLKTDKRGSGLFCEDCSKDMIEKIKTACDSKNIPFAIRRYNLEQIWKGRR